MRCVTSRLGRASTRTLAFLILTGGVLTTGVVHGQTTEETFTLKCGICHTIGMGRLVGPDLRGVSDRRSEEWITNFIRSSQAVISSGDAEAVKLFEEYGKVIMPDPELDDTQIKALIEFIKTAPDTGPAGMAPIGPATPENILLGRKLFQGDQRLTNGGPTCTACHDVTQDAIISGGVLAKELTTVFTRLGGPGVRAIIGSPPFPVMQQAYKDAPLTDQEVAALVAFLEDVNAGQQNHMPRDTGIKLAASGVAGSVILLLLYSLLWRKRKRLSVNQAIYDRQVRSI